MQSKHFFRISQDKSGINLLCLNKIALIGVNRGQCLGAKAELRILPTAAFRLVITFGFEVGEDIVLVLPHGGILLRREEISSGDTHCAAILRFR